MTKQTNIAFFGLGKMGGPMAKNLIEKGYHLNIYDPFAEALASFTQANVHIAQSAQEAVENVDVVISMLPAGSHVVHLYTGDDSTSGVLSHLDKNALVIDCSTIDVDSVKQVHRAASELGIAMIDAPVSGGVGGAQAGTLTFMCGCNNKSDFAKAKDILADMGKNIFHAGNIGDGQVAKMCNNMLLAIHMVGTAEALKLGQNNGLDVSVLSEIMQQSSGSNWSLEKYNPAPGVMPQSPASNNFAAGFTVELMLKDLGLALDNSAGTKSTTPMGALAKHLYASLAQQQQDSRLNDFSSIWKMF